MRAPIGSFEDALPAADRLGLLTEPVAAAVRAGWGGVPAEHVIHVDTDPAIADTAVFVEHHGAELLDRSANCVIVAESGAARSRSRPASFFHAPGST